MSAVSAPEKEHAQRQRHQEGKEVDHVESVECHHSGCRGPYPMGGDSTTPWATGISTFALSCEGAIGPPFRFVVDLGNLRNSWGLLVPGQSGQPGSKHYDDQVQAWFEGGSHTMLYAREDVGRETEASLRLLPSQ